MLVYEGGYYNNTSIDQLEKNDSKVCRNQRRASADQIAYEQIGLKGWDIQNHIKPPLSKAKIEKKASSMEQSEYLSPKGSFLPTIIERRG